VENPLEGLTFDLASAVRHPDLSAPASRVRIPFASVPGPKMTMRAQPWRKFDRPECIAHWKALAQWATEPNPFYESWYLLPSLRSLDPEGEVEILSFAIDGEMAGLMPIVRPRRYYRYPLPHLSNWVHPNCFLGTPLVAAGCERAFWRELLAWADRHCGLSLFLHLMQMPLAGPVHEALEAVLEERHRSAGIVMREERAVLSSPLSREDYLLEVCSRKKLRDLRRKQNRLEEMGRLDFVWSWDDCDIDRWIEDFLRIEGSGWKREAGSALACARETAQLFREVTRGAASEGKLVRLSVMLDDRPIAMLCNFVCKPGSFGFKTAFDEQFRSWSPGVLMEHEYLTTLDNRDILWCDSCAAEDHNVMDDLWVAGRSIGRMSFGIGGRARRGIFRQILAVEMARQHAGNTQ
jgi:CelD/BcsL family acetyltransferase involved in cellulose biosynthesis